jgi:hypothetical protein
MGGVNHSALFFIGFFKNSDQKYFALINSDFGLPTIIKKLSRKWLFISQYQLHP